MDAGWVIALGLLLVGVVWILVKQEKQAQKDRRIPTEGWVTSMGSETRTGMGSTMGGYSTTQSYVETVMRFEFYVDGKKLTGRKTVSGELAKKEKGDRIFVYYLPENPGKDQVLED